MQKNYTRTFLASYNQNAVLQLIVASCTGYISYKLAYAVLIIVDAQPETFPEYFTQNIALPDLAFYTHKFWTVFTYGWVYNGFWELFSNMIWLYTFGSLVQMLVGYKQIIPMFVYALVVGGIFFEACQLFPGAAFDIKYSLLGAHAGVMALAVAALTISPNYRFYLGEHFSIPIVVVACIFFVLAVMNSNLEAPRLFLLAGGALTGFGYVKILQAGYKPGAWIYNFFEGLTNLATPNEYDTSKHNTKRGRVLKMEPPKKNSPTKRIDELLDKINQKGYESLTKEEKEFLLKASNENDN